MITNIQKIKITKQVWLFFTMFFLFLITPNLLHALEPVISMNETVYIVDKPVEQEIILYNYFDADAYFVLKLNTAPFDFHTSVYEIFIPKKSYKSIKFTLFPLDNSSGEVYSASVELYSPFARFIKHFTVDQAFNKTCETTLKVDSEYLGSDIHTVELLFENPTLKDQDILFNDDQNLFFLKKITIPKNSEYLFKKNISIDGSELSISYTCNDVFISQKHNLKKPIKLTGFFSLGIFEKIFNLLFFKILLVIILIFLVISFTTRYLRYIHDKS